jgi:hypothetical protein
LDRREHYEDIPPNMNYLIALAPCLAVPSSKRMVYTTIFEGLDNVRGEVQKPLYLFRTFTKREVPQGSREGEKGFAFSTD